MSVIVQFVKIARDVRAKLLASPHTPPDLAGECGLASMLIADAMDAPSCLRTGFYMKGARFSRKRGRKWGYWPYQHAWCQIDDTIIDATATQFSCHNRAVHVASFDEDGRYLETAHERDAISNIMNNWLGRELNAYRVLARSLRQKCASRR